MPPQKPLPISDEFGSTEEYVESLLNFASVSEAFQIFCGGVHILDFFTNEPGLFQWILQPDWQEFLMRCEPMVLLDFLLRDDLESPPSDRAWPDPPESLRQYVKDVRRHSLSRSFTPVKPKLPVIPRQVAVGMNVKKVHEVTNFADYVDRLAADIAQATGTEMTHFIDFGSGQNYLGRTLASAPYSKNIVAVEGRENNQAGARELDVFAGFAQAEKVMRNKKVWQSLVDSQTPVEQLDPKALRRLAAEKPLAEQMEGVDLRPRKELKAVYRPEVGKGLIKYITGQLETGDLSEVLSKIHDADVPEEQRKELSLMAISIHSCGNLSHFGIRSMLLNPSIKAVAIVGCCYNLLTEKLGPPTYKLPYMRPSLQAINGRVVRESEKYDPQGFPMSQRVSTYNEQGIRFNITARMMACQAPQNWTEKESDSFFTRHFYRAVLQKMFLDKGVISKVYHNQGEDSSDSQSNGGPKDKDSPFNVSTNPVIIGSLGKSCYKSFHTYVRGAIKKLTTNDEYSQYSKVIGEKMGNISDEEIDGYVTSYARRKRELSAVWSLMAFSACVVESLIVTDRWLFLREHADVVEDSWVESVFDYKESPRNLVVVGIKKKEATCA